MPTTTMKVKSGNEYDVKYKVDGSLSDLTREEVEQLAVRYLRNAARAYCVQKLNEAEPAIVTNSKMKDAMVAAGLADETTAKAFFVAQDMPLEIPSTFEIPVDELIPSSEGGRGKKAADIFSFAEKDEADS